MDLSKAFDTVDKNILNEKLTNLGFDNDSTSLINSYMTQRKFCFSEDTTDYTLTYGVPQGSILGPLLFILYTNDITNVGSNDNTTVYADDTTLVISGDSIKEATDKANLILRQFVHYFNVNKLSINPDKTKYMVIKPKRKKLSNKGSQNLVMDEKILEEVNTIKYLGTILNNKLTWDDHKLYVKRKVCQSIGIIYHCKGIMNDYQLINMYKTFIQSQFQYAIEAWGHSVKAENDILTKAQNKVLRVLFDSKRSDDAWRHANGRISNIHDLYKQTLTKICTKHHSKSLPTYFSQKIMPTIKTNQGHDHALRSNNTTQHDYLLNKLHDTETTNFQTECITTWNSLNTEIKNKPYEKGQISILKPKIMIPRTHNLF